MKMFVMCGVRLSRPGAAVFLQSDLQGGTSLGSGEAAAVGAAGALQEGSGLHQSSGSLCGLCGRAGLLRRGPGSAALHPGAAAW